MGDEGGAFTNAAGLLTGAFLPLEAAGGSPVLQNRISRYGGTGFPSAAVGSSTIQLLGTQTAV
ncbi:MAG: hypothetical protein OSJ58_04135 [Dysosmobacter sp.]|nr:hypothetical protein [Dysosmobacter sp.]